MRRLLTNSVFVVASLLIATTAMAQSWTSVASVSSSRIAYKYPLNGSWTRTATQLSRIESDAGQGLVQQLFKKEVTQYCDFHTVFRGRRGWPIPWWTAHSAVPYGYVKHYSTFWYTVFVNPECACGAHEQKLTLLEADTDNSPEVKLVCDVDPASSGDREYLYGQGDMESLPIPSDDMMDTSSAPDQIEISIEAEKCEPDCSSPSVTETIPSYGPKAIILMDGDNLEEKALAKGLTLQQAQDGRVLGGAALAPFVDQNGDIDFGADAGTTLAIIYEQDGADEADVKWAWDDHMQIVDACGGVDDDTPPPPVTVTLRDSIGPDSSMTDWNGRYDIGWVPTHQRVVAFEVSPGEDVTLSELQAVIVNGAPPGTDLIWSEFDYRIHVWEDLNTAFANPSGGTLGTYVIDDLIEPAQMFGTTNTYFGPRDTYKLRIDLTSADIQVPSSGTRAIGFTIEANSSTGSPEICESNESGATDWGYTASQWYDTATHILTQHDGRLGVKLISTVN